MAETLNFSFPPTPTIQEEPPVAGTQEEIQQPHTNETPDMGAATEAPVDIVDRPAAVEPTKTVGPSGRVKKRYSNREVNYTDGGDVPVATDEPETQEDLTEAPLENHVDKHNKKKHPLAKAAVLAAGGLAVVGGLVGVGANKLELGGKPATTETLAPSPESAYTGIGNIKIGLVRPNDATIKFADPSGQEVSIPKLRTGTTDANSFAESALGLYAHYVSTGNPTILKELTNNTNTQASIKSQAESWVANSANPGKHFALQIFDKEANPARFVQGTDSNGKYIRLSSGDLYSRTVQADGDTTVQANDPTTVWSSEKQITSLNIYVDASNHITGFRLAENQITPTVPRNGGPQNLQPAIS